MFVLDSPSTSRLGLFLIIWSSVTSGGLVYVAAQCLFLAVLRSTSSTNNHLYRLRSSHYYSLSLFQFTRPRKLVSDCPSFYSPRSLITLTGLPTSTTPATAPSEFSPFKSSSYPSGVISLKPSKDPPQLHKMWHIQGRVRMITAKVAYTPSFGQFNPFRLHTAYVHIHSPY